MPHPQDESARAKALREHPEFPFLTHDSKGVTAVMERSGYLRDGQEVATVSKAGEGNMNLTLRVALNDGSSVILKQSRPWVEKYDAIAAPFDRAISEARFYDVAGRISGVGERMPRLLGSDEATRTLLLEDLGEASDLAGAYGHGEISHAELKEAGQFLRALHNGTAADAFLAGLDRAATVNSLMNMEMRRLNHSHIFRIPLTDHGFFRLDDLETGLADAAAEVRADVKHCQAVTDLGEIYLEEGGEVLLHGDFFPGSLLRTPGGLRVIDPEFCFFGPREFDLGIFVAHLALADQPPASVTAFLTGYQDFFGAGLMSQFAAVEVMRRLIGVAQLPLGQTDGNRSGLLLRSRQALLADDWRLLWRIGA